MRFNVLRASIILNVLAFCLLLVQCKNNQKSRVKSDDIVKFDYPNTGTLAPRTCLGQ